METGKLISPLKGRLALVTGSTSGIGLGIACDLAKRGCDVILNNSSGKTVKLLTEIQSEYGVKTKHFSADLSKTAEVELICKQITQLYPAGIDILVNNAGFQFVCPVEEFPQEKWDKMLAVLLTAPFQLTKYLMPAMKAKGWGRIINISSSHGHVASPNKSCYVAAKHGLIGLTKAVALETAGTGVTCNVISPGYVATLMTEPQVQTVADTKGITFEEAENDILFKYHPSKQPVEVDQIADTIAFLCSDATAQMTGTSLLLDGGCTAR